jgi:hypothetical protein
MKPKLFLAAAFILLAQLSFAQFNIGIKGGANISKIEGKAFKDEFSYGYLLGGFAEIGLGKKFSLKYYSINTRRKWTAILNLFTRMHLQKQNRVGSS